MIAIGTSPFRIVRKVRSGFRAAWTEINGSREEAEHTKRLQDKIDRSRPLYPFDYSKVEFIILSSDGDFCTGYSRHGSAARFRLTLHSGKTVDVTILIDTYSAIRYDWPNSLKESLRAAVREHDIRIGIADIRIGIADILGSVEARTRIVCAIKHRAQPPTMGCPEGLP